MFERYSRSGLALVFAPLYAGPIAAGWSKAPPMTLVIFAAVFFLLQLRPGAATDKNITTQVFGLLFLACVQVCIVALAYAIGMGMALLTAPLPLPLWFPLALTGCSAALAALRYRQSQDDTAMLDLIDRTIDTLENGAPFDKASDDPVHKTATAETLTELYALSDTATPAQIDPIVQRLEEQCGHLGFFELLGEIDEGYRNVDLAMLRYLCSPNVRRGLILEPQLGFTLDQILQSDDLAVLTELTQLIKTLSCENAPDCALPPVQSLIKLAKQFPTLAPLIARMQTDRDSKPPQERSGD